MSNLNEELRAKGVAQVIVVLKAPGVAAASVRARGAAAAGGVLLTQGELSQHFVAPARGAALAAAAGQAAPPAGVRFYPNLGVALGTVTRQGLAGLRADRACVAEVVQAPEMRPIRPVRVAAATAPDDVTWGIKAMRVPQLWDQGLTGQGILIGHLDTGVNGTHSAFQGGAIAHFAEFDDFGREVNPAPAPHDTDFFNPGHGTHSAATIVGRAVRGKKFGVAPGATLASAVVIEGGDVIARILGGMDWAVGLGVRILNMSLGLPGFDDSFLPLTQLLRARGILPVFAVGNEGPGTSRSPGNYVEALSVGASGPNGRVADFSSSEDFARPGDPTVPDLVAPGVDVISAKPGGGVQEMSGSSMAAPHISGLAALLMQAAPAATIAQVERAIYDSCRPLPNDPAGRQGRGLPDGPDALVALQAALASGAAPAATPKAARGKAATPKRAARKKAAAAPKRAARKKAAAGAKSTTRKKRR